MVHVTDQQSYTNLTLIVFNRYTRFIMTAGTNSCKDRKVQTTDRQTDTWLVFLIDNKTTVTIIA